MLSKNRHGQLICTHAHLEIAIAPPILMKDNKPKVHQTSATPWSTQASVYRRDRHPDWASVAPTRPVGAPNKHLPERLRTVSLYHFQKMKSYEHRRSFNASNFLHIQRQPCHNTHWDGPKPAAYSHWPTSGETVQRWELPGTDWVVQTQIMAIALLEVNEDDEGSQTSHSDALAHSDQTSYAMDCPA